MQIFVRVSIISAMIVSAMFSCKGFTQRLNQGLEDEKSYTRHAMEAYRKNPGAFLGNKNVLETWSKSDYIALAVARQKKHGNWADNSDKLDFLEPNLQHDATGSPFCVIQQGDYVIVLSIRSAVVPNCSADLIKKINIDQIKSGDMEFSGRSDYWVYVLRLGAGSPDTKR
jgi:hypothetical protein